MSQKGSIALILLVLVLLALFSTGGYFIYLNLKPQTQPVITPVKTPTLPSKSNNSNESTPSSQSAVPLKTEYQNPFDSTAQASNPFDSSSVASTDNPFNNLQ